MKKAILPFQLEGKPDKLTNVFNSMNKKIEPALSKLVSNLSNQPTNQPTTQQLKLN